MVSDDEVQTADIVSSSLGGGDIRQCDGLVLMVMIAGVARSTGGSKTIAKYK